MAEQRVLKCFNCDTVYTPEGSKGGWDELWWCKKCNGYTTHNEDIPIPKKGMDRFL